MDLMDIGRYYPQLSFSLVGSLSAQCIGNACFVAQYAATRLGLEKYLLTKCYLYHASTTLNYVPARYVARAKADLLFGHEYFPANIGDDLLPVIFETGMQTDAVIKNSRQGYSDTDVRAHRANNVRMKTRCAKQSTLINVREPHGAEMFKALIPEAASKVRTVPPYLSYINPLSDCAVKAKQSAPEPVRILFVGNLARQKGLGKLYRAIAALPDHIADRISLTVVSQFLDGEVPAEGLAVRVIQGGRLGWREVLTGRGVGTRPLRQGPLTVDQVLALMAQSHIFVLPTLSDTFGFVLLEAMANGCAVVGPDREPQRWILEHGRAGMVVDPEDPASIGNALERLVSDTEFRTGLALRGLNRFVSAFDHRVSARGYMDLFEEACERWRSKHRGRP